MRKPRFSKTLYLKLMFTYLPMVVLSIVCTTILLAYATGRHMKKAMDTLYNATIHSTADILDSKLGSVSNTLFQLSCSTLIEDLRKMKQPYSIDDLNHIANLVDELSTATVCDDMIRKIFVYHPQRDYILAGQAKSNKLYFLRENYPGTESNRIMALIEGAGQSGLFSVPLTEAEASAQGGMFPVTLEDQQILTLVMHVPLISNNPDLYVCAILNSQALHSPSVITLDTSENLLFLNREGVVVYNYKPGFAENAYDIDNIDAWAMQSDSLVYTMESSRTGLTYIYMNQSSFVREQLLYITLLAIIIGSIFVLAVVVMVVVSSKRICVPVTSLLSLFDGRSKTARPLSDLDLIREKVFELYQDKNEMSQRIESVQSSAIEWSLERVLSQNSIPEKEAVSLADLKISFRRKNAGVCILKLMHYAKLKEQYSETSMIEFKQKLAALLRDQLIAYGDPYIIFMDSQLVTAINYDMRPETIQDVLQEQLFSLQKMVWRTFHLDLHAVIGDLITVEKASNENILAAFYRSYLSAYKSLEHLFFIQDPVILLASPGRDRSRTGVYDFSHESEIALINLLFTGQGDDAIRRLEKIIALNRGTCDYANMKQLLSELISVPIKAVLKNNGSPDEVIQPRNVLFEKLEACDTLEDAAALIKDVYRRVSDYFSTINAKWPMSKKEVLDYIESHYMDDIGINDAADHFALSPGYFSRIFKQMMHDSFTEYLTQYRISKAEKIILEKHISLKDIASQVGFNSYKSFYRSFKKQTLCNPHEYKQKIQGSGEDSN